MGLEKMPLSSEIPWGAIKGIRVSEKDGAFSFEFDVNGQRQKITISIKPGQTSYVLSKDDGTPIVHATQKGRGLSVMDFSSRPSIPPWLKKMQKKGAKHS